MQPALYIGADRLELFPDESINLNQSVQSLRDLTKVFTEFTKSFKVPASATNNRIFKHYYQSQIDNGFDARTKMPARIEINGITFKIGKMQLNSVGIKSNVPEFYDIEFFGNTIDIKDLLGDDTLRDLTTLSDLDFSYTGANVRSRLQSSGQDIAFSLTSYKRRFLYNSGGNLSNDEQVNIKYDPNYTDGINYEELKGFVKCKAIIEAIENEPRYGLTFSRDFYDSAEFNQLYMSLGNGKIDSGYLSSTEIYSVNFDSFSSSTAITINNFFSLRIIPPNNNLEYKVNFVINGDKVFSSNLVTGDKSFRYDQKNIASGNYDVKYFIETKTAFNVQVNTFYLNYETLSNVFSSEQTSTNVLTQVPDFDILNTIAPIKVLDWFSAIIKTFNLVIEPQQDGTLYINDLNSWYKDGDITDISEYIDISTKTVSRGELFREISFKYEDSEQVLAAQYEQEFGKQFGAEEISLDGLATDDTLEIELPFENPQFEAINDSLVQYAFIVDSNLDPYSNKPFLCYLPNVDLDNGDFRLGFNTETSYTVLNRVNVPSHSINVNGGFAAQFAAEFSEYNGALLSDNLYSRFYSDYFNDLFSIKRRKYNFDAFIPSSLLPQIQMNERLIINGERYVIDNIETNLLTGVTKLVLLNDLFETLYQSDTTSSLNAKFGEFSESGSFYYSGKSSIVQAFTNDDFITIISGINARLITFDLAENNTGLDRAGLIQIQDGLSDPSFVVVQKAKPIGEKWDSNMITLDSNLITF